MNPAPDVSVVIPVKDEAPNIERLAAELTRALQPCPWSWECVWVDDGSTDETPAHLRRCSASDPRQRYLVLTRNEGQSAALWAGFQAARGRILATLDGDGQNDPADLPRLVDMILNGQADMVNGFRVRRKDSGLRKTASRLANAFRNGLTGRTVRDVGCSTRAFRRECVACVPLFKGMHRFFPTLVSWQGFRLAEMPVHHRPRVKGVSKYSILNRLWIGLADTFGVCWLGRRVLRYRVKQEP
ncbi:MAG: glycosyltransferase family 2 protein [Lentisphaerae bacterium]|nr:glycosyltransferase family 2 protein [Lentisphaerota bacterium]